MKELLFTGLPEFFKSNHKADTQTEECKQTASQKVT